MSWTIGEFGASFPSWVSSAPSALDQAAAFFRETQSPPEPQQLQHSGATGAVGVLPYLAALSLVDAGPQSSAEGAGPLRTLYQWSQIDFEFRTPQERQQALDSGRFVPSNALPLGLDAYGDRVFVSVPRWKDGIPATLAALPKDPALVGSVSPPLRPYPSWEWHETQDCSGLSSVYRMQTDTCGRLWVLDSGVVNAVTNLRQECPPKIVVFDLSTDSLVTRYVLPSDQVKQTSLFTNIVTDVRDGKCDDAFAYATDVWGFALVVFSLRQGRSWRVSHPFFYPDPLAARYQLHGVTFRWTDGVFGLSLSQPDYATGDRTMFFHPMTSFREFAVQTSVLRNETAASKSDDEFFLLEEPRGLRDAHASTSAMDRQGVMFYNLVTRDSVGCWNSQQPYGYRLSLQGVVAHDNVTLVFPNDLKVDHEPRQSLWVLSNRLPLFLYSSLDPRDVNIRIMRAYADEAVRGTVCDPRLRFVPGYGPLSERELLCHATPDR